MDWTKMRTTKKKISVKTFKLNQLTKQIIGFNKTEQLKYIIENNTELQKLKLLIDCSK